MTLPPRYFSWRLRGAPLSWHDDARLSQPYELIIATSMVDLATLKGLNPQLAAVPAVLYFHENQFCYPANSQSANGQSATDTDHLTAVDRQMVQLYSALAADAIAFNSAYNRDTFLAGVAALCKKLPDFIDTALGESLAAKAEILPIAIDWPGLVPAQPRIRRQGPPRIVWNHRVEYDKGPEEFYQALQELEPMDFRLILLGQRFRQVPKAWQQLTATFAKRILFDGYCPDRQQYLSWLHQGDIVISTSHHEFQGLAFLEAIGCGLTPLAPNRLVYPEYLAPEYLYDGGAKGLAAALEQIVAQRTPLPKPLLPKPLLPKPRQAMTRTASREGWQRLIARLTENRCYG